MRPVRTLTAGVLAGVTLSLGPAPVAAEDVDRLLERAVTASNEYPHAGTLTVASFSTSGPQLTQLEVTTTMDGSLRLVRSGGWEIGRAGSEAFLRRSGTLLRIGGTERTPFDRDRLRRKYDVEVDGTRPLDTGQATVLVLRERATGVLREMLYVDADTELVVRRETFDRTGSPVRVVAFTRLDVADAAVTMPEPDGREVEDHERTAMDAAELRDRGFLVPASLPNGYQLLGRYEVEDAAVPTLHLLYGDGLYTVSLFEQQGRLSMEAVRRAERLTTQDGGAVWRWPGSEPRRIVWAGDGLTFTALTDAPTDELLTVISGLPTDAAPSILDRLSRGLSRLGRWLVPGS